jgi:bacterioferritin
MLQCDLALEYDAVPMLREGIQYCEEVRDYVSRDLIQKILDAEEEHIDWLETQLSLIKQVGLELYLQAQM